MSRAATLLLLLGLALAASGCREDRCKSAEPAFQLDVSLAGGSTGAG